MLTASAWWKDGTWWAPSVGGCMYNLIPARMCRSTNVPNGRLVHQLGRLRVLDFGQRQPFSSEGNIVKVGIFALHHLLEVNEPVDSSNLCQKVPNPVILINTKKA